MKSAVVLVCLALVAASSAVPVKEPRGNLVTEVIQRLIDSNRDKLVDLKIAQIVLGDAGQGVLNDILVKNAETFVVEALEGPVLHQFLVSNLTISIADASASAVYDFKDLLVDSIGIVLNGAGAAQGAITGGWAEVTDAQLQIVGLGVQLDDFAGFRMGVRGATVALEGQTDETNTALGNALGPFLDNELQGLIEANKAAIIAKINEILDGII